MTDARHSDGRAGHGDAGEDPDLPRVRQALAGDQQAYEQLVLAHQRRVFNVAYRVLGDYEEARDLAQETFIQAHRSLGRFRGEAPFVSWLLAIAVNQCRNRLRHWKRRAHSRHESLSDPPGGEGSGPERRLPDAGASALERLEGRQLEEFVHEELGRLDEEYRTVLVLRELQGVAYEEIARILAVPAGTVKSRLHRGRIELRERLRRRLSGGRGSQGGSPQ